MKSENVSHSVLSNYLWCHRSQPTRLLCPWDSLGKNTGVGCLFLLQGIFSTQGSNPCLLCLLHWQVGSLPLAPPGKFLRDIRLVHMLHGFCFIFHDCIGWTLEKLRNKIPKYKWLRLCEKHLSMRFSAFYIYDMCHKQKIKPEMSWKWFTEEHEWGTQSQESSELWL